MEHQRSNTETITKRHRSSKSAKTKVSYEEIKSILGRIEQRLDNIERIIDSQLKSEVQEWIIDEYKKAKEPNENEQKCSLCRYNKPNDQRRFCMLCHKRVCIDCVHVGFPIVCTKCR